MARVPKKQRENLSCTVPADIFDKLIALANYDERTKSRMAALAIKDFVKRKEAEDHPALLKFKKDNKEGGD